MPIFSPIAIWFNQFVQVKVLRGLDKNNAHSSLHSLPREENDRPAPGGIEALSQLLIRLEVGDWYSPPKS
jgi:hypothetical protein